MKRHHHDKEPSRIEMSEGDLEKLINEIKASSLAEKSKELMISVLLSFLWINQQLEQKTLSLKKLLRLFFGSKTEKQKKDQSAKPKPEAKPKDEKGKPRKKGHGKNGQSDFPDAERVKVSHPKLKVGDNCPSCIKGFLYQMGFAAVLRIFGQPPLTAKVYELESLRCSSCQEVFTAPLPQEAGSERNHPTAKAMVAVLNYGTGMPFYRLEGLQKLFCTPVPDATQFDMVEDVADSARPAVEHMKKLAANSRKFGNDDTPMPIAELKKENETLSSSERKGIQTTALLADCDEHKIALFMSGRNHSGENVGDVLQLRDKNLPPPMQVSDAAPLNFSHEFAALIAKILCLDHARRNFIDIQEKFPKDCHHVILALGKVYHNDALAKQMGLTPKERLLFHQEHSQPIMNELNTWMEEKFENREVEPNSQLGKAIEYFLSHWNGLTQFLRIEDAPLSNADVERLIKRCVLRRKNSLRYKTQVGAWVGDVLMSAIETCRLNKENPHHYLVALQQHARHVREHPEKWLPWTYRQTIASLAT